MILTGTLLREAAGEDFDPDGIGADVHVRMETVVMPHDYAIVLSAESLAVPRDAAATITGRSAHMRQGVTMPGGIVDPGFTGRLTLEFFNHSDEPFVLEEGEAGGRLVFFQLAGPAERYSGQWAEVEERFWSKVDRSGDCWSWTGAMNGDYGHFESPEGWSRQAHRVAWRLENGDPGDSMVLHSCDNPPCVNPGHLYLGDAKRNARDMMEAGSHNFSSLTMQDAREIRERYEGGETQVDLAEAYGTSQSNISRIVNWRRSGRGTRSTRRSRAP